mgnify:CR=1 FL=1
MKKGTKYSEKVIAFALTERSRRKRWKDIENAIKQEFQIEPPSERQMRNWYREYGGGTIDPEKLLRESLIKMVRDSTPVLALAAQQNVIERGIPRLLQAFERRGTKYVQKEDPAVVIGLFLLSYMEESLGEKFDEVLRRYNKIRGGKGQ